MKNFDIFQCKKDVYSASKLDPPPPPDQLSVLDLVMYTVREVGRVLRYMTVWSLNQIKLQT